MSALDNSALSPSQSFDPPPFPTEIFVEIFSLVTREALLPLSVCSREFRAIALALLFRGLRVRVSNRESFEALWNISQTDYLANFVKSMQIEELTNIDRPIDPSLLSNALPFFPRLHTLALSRSSESRQVVAFDHSLQLAILNHPSLLSLDIDGVYDFDPDLRTQVVPRNGRSPLTVAAISSSAVLPTHVELPFFQHLSHLGIHLSSLSVRLEESGSHLLSHVVVSGLQSLHIKAPYQPFPSSNRPSADWIPRFINTHPLLRSIRFERRITFTGLASYLPSSSLAAVPGFEGFNGIDRWWKSMDASCEEVVLEFSRATPKGTRTLEGLTIKAGKAQQIGLSDLEEINASFPTLQRLRFKGWFELVDEEGNHINSQTLLPSLLNFINTFPPFPHLIDLNLPRPSSSQPQRQFCSHIIAAVDAHIRGTSRRRVDLLERLSSMPVSRCGEDATVLEIWTALAKNLPALKYLSWELVEYEGRGLDVRLHGECREWVVVRERGGGGGARLWDRNEQLRLDRERGCVGSRRELIRLLAVDDETFRIVVGVGVSGSFDEEA